MDEVCSNNSRHDPVISHIKRGWWYCDDAAVQFCVAPTVPIEISSRARIAISANGVPDMRDINRTRIFLAALSTNEWQGIICGLVDVIVLRRSRISSFCAYGMLFSNHLLLYFPASMVWDIYFKRFNREIYKWVSLILPLPQKVFSCYQLIRQQQT